MRADGPRCGKAPIVLGTIDTVRFDRRLEHTYSATRQTPRLKYPQKSVIEAQSLENLPMPDLIVFGTGDVAQLADFYFTNDSDSRVVAFTVDGALLKQDSFCGKPVVPFEEISQHYPANRHAFFAAVGYAKLNKVRAEKIAVARSQGYRIASYVSSKATVFSDFKTGENVFILEDNTIQPFTRIGDNVTLWSGNHIGHHSVIEDDCFIASHVVVSGGVRIGAGTFVGVNVTIRDRVQIGQRCVLGAGSLILSDAPDESVFSPGATERSKVPSSRLRGI
jgi:sugar O-acyltransferase (sialic acid O-acetyltransferase NeuD family)